MGVEMPVERVEMRLSSMAVRERKVCFDVVEFIDGCCIDYLDTIEIGYQTCRNVFYKSYATGLIPVRNGKGVRGPPLFDFIRSLNCSKFRAADLGEYFFSKFGPKNRLREKYQ